MPARKKIYTVCAITYSLGRISDVICGYTVADSDEEVSRIIRMHIPHKRFSVYMASAGDSDPAIASAVAETLERYGFDWLDSRLKVDRDGDATSGPLVVHKLLTEAAKN